MRLPDMVLSVRASDIAQSVTSIEHNRWVVIGDVVVLSVSVVGASLILANMFANEIRQHAATTRMRIVQALIFSDVAMGIVGLVGCAFRLYDGGMQTGSRECNGIGLLIVAIMWSQHLWTLALALATFMILVHPLHQITSWIEKFWNWSWLVIWSLAFGVSVLGYELYGYERTGGICFWGNKSGLFGELIQFIPRLVVFISITLIYGRLYIFLKRPDKIRSGFSDGSTGSTSFSRFKGSWFTKSKSRRRFPFISGETKTVIVNQNGDRVGIDTSNSSTSKKSTASESRASTPKPPPPPLAIDPRYSQNRAQPADDIPPWERIELPAFQVDGQRYGGPESNGRTWGEWRGFSQGPKKRAVPPNLSTSSVPSCGSTKVAGESPLQSPTALVFAKGGKASTPTSATFDQRGLSTPSSKTVTPGSTPPDQVAKEDVSPTSDEHSPLDIDNFKPAPPFWTTEKEESSDDITALRRSSAPEVNSEPVVAPATRRPSFIPSFLRPGVPKPPSDNDQESDVAPLPNPEDVERGVVEDDGKWDLKRMLEMDPGNGDDPFAVTNKSDNVEYVPESMASYLNRKTALLMLWFPLGYVLLFSVSLIRLIYDFTGEPPRALRAISRWMIFGQGVLDFIIYGLVEWHTKRVVRRRVRKGTFSPRTSNTAGSGVGSQLRALSTSMLRSSRSPTSSGNQPATTSQIGRSQPQQVSFVDPASIMQRLEGERHDRTLNET